jgi:hypothetical protein
MAMEEKLSARQRLFCMYLARTEDPVEAARLAGFKTSRVGAEAVRLLDRAEIQAETERWRKIIREHRDDAALAGLVRLAAGNIGDVVKLVCQSAAPEAEELSSMDLFAVSDLKRGKDGGLEVKLYDRLKALELLLTHQAGDEGAGSLYAALDAAVSGLSEAAGDSLPGGGDCAV